MKHWTSTRMLSRLEANRRVSVDNLKACPLCGAVNAIQNKECFVCQWHGQFDHDAEVIEEGVMELLERCPELIEVMMEEPVLRRTLFERLKGVFFGLFRKNLDLRV